MRVFEKKDSCDRKPEEITDCRHPQDIYLIHTLILRWDGKRAIYFVCVFVGKFVCIYLYAFARKVISQ